jgi:hypothetical protein
LLFKKRFFAGLLDGSVTLTFRRWQKPHVRAGGRYRTHPIGVLEVDGVGLVAARDVTDADAVRAGFGSGAELLAHLSELGPLEPSSPLYRVEFHHGGEGDRVALALEDAHTPDDVAAIAARLAKLDGRRPWTMETLRLIRRRPRIAASKLAKSVGREKLPFKEDVRRLKRLGLTQSFEVGYEVSPRGRAWLAAAAKAAKAQSRSKKAQTSRAKKSGR